jgi:hypothetical protein
LQSQNEQQKKQAAISQTKSGTTESATIETTTVPENSRIEQTH